MMLISIFIVIAVGLLAFSIISRPFHEGVEEVNADVLLRDEEMITLETKCRSWLRDLESEFHNGKMDQQDYQRQKAVLEKQVDHIESRLAEIRSEKLQNGERGLEELINGRRMERVERSAGFCVRCGAPLQQSDKFCSSCGMQLK